MPQSLIFVKVAPASQEPCVTPLRHYLRWTPHSLSLSLSLPSHGGIPSPGTRPTSSSLDAKFVSNRKYSMILKVLAGVILMVEDAPDDSEFIYDLIDCHWEP